MNLESSIIQGFLPEIIIITTILICTILSFCIKNTQKPYVYFTALTGCLTALFSFVFLPKEASIECFNLSFISDYYSLLFRFLILIGTVITFQLSKKYTDSFGIYKGEYYTLFLCAALGAMLMTGSTDLIMATVAIETLGISAYALCGFTRSDRLSSEAALKYLVIGGASTAVTLYGFSLLYGITGSTNFNEIYNFLSVYKMNPILVLSLLMVIGGLGFKISAFPFHSWTPDVYEGAPLPVAAFLSVVSKIAGFAIILRLIGTIFINYTVWTYLIGIIAILTMFAGNLCALKQQNIKRLLGYSSIAQAGYILLGLAVGTQDSFSAIIFYLICYLFMNFGAWAAIEVYTNRTGKYNISDFKGLAYREPVLAFGLSVCMLSLAGIPVTAGFIGKFYLFKTILFSGVQNLWLLIFALFNTLIAVYYYLMVVKSLFSIEKTECNSEQCIIPKSRSLNSIQAVTFCVVLILGIFATPFITVSQKASYSLFSNIKSFAFISK